MSGELWCAVDYDGNSLSHASRNDKRLGTNPKKKKQVRVVREVQGPSLGYYDYQDAYNEQIKKGNKKKANEIANAADRAYIADTGLNKKGKATKNYKDLNRLSFSKSTEKNYKDRWGSDYLDMSFKKGDQLVPSNVAKKALNTVKKRKKK